MPEKLVEDLIDLAIREDIGEGDHTSMSCIRPDAKGMAHLIAKEKGIIAGVEVARKILFRFDAHASFTPFITDGAKFSNGDIIFKIEALSLAILQAERLMLNILQRMSGIATQTARYADIIKDLKTKVLDTRKTSPGMRWFEKEAVKIGGGMNHRFGLYDMILLKDNHIDFAGGIEAAIKQTQIYLAGLGKKLSIIIEARSLDDVRKILETGGVDRIMLDNFSVGNTRKAVEMINGKYQIESSGNISLENIRAYAECGVDFISVGALTHQVRSIDLSLKAII